MVTAELREVAVLLAASGVVALVAGLGDLGKA